eukprot:SAG11_NODE_754_length_7332_cov_5.256325_1_plen_264_part_00
MFKHLTSIRILVLSTGSILRRILDASCSCSWQLHTSSAGATANWQRHCAAVDSGGLPWARQLASGRCASRRSAATCRSRTSGQRASPTRRPASRRAASAASRPVASHVPVPCSRRSGPPRHCVCAAVPPAPHQNIRTPRTAVDGRSLQRSHPQSKREAKPLSPATLADEGAPERRRRQSVAAAGRGGGGWSGGGGGRGWAGAMGDQVGRAGFYARAVGTASSRTSDDSDRHAPGSAGACGREMAGWTEACAALYTTDQGTITR